MEALESAGGRDSALCRRTSRPHFQSRSWNSSGDSGRERQSVMCVRARALGGVQEMSTCPLVLGSHCYCANQVKSFSGGRSETAVLLLAHGTPENSDQVPEYLLNVTGGRALPPQVIEE